MLIANAYHHKKMGFTLLELLLTITIMAMAAVIVIFTFNKNHIDMGAKAAIVLSGQTSELINNALVRGKSYALIFDQQGYEFFLLKGNKLVPLQQYRQSIPSRYSIESSILPSKTTIDVLPSLGNFSGSTIIWLWGNGEITPFSISIKDSVSGRIWLVDVQKNGKVDYHEQPQ